jgi:hypothetical protein
MADAYTVKVTVEITNRQQGYTSQPERVSYGQQFDIPARGWAHVARILGDLDQAIGTIERCKDTVD